MYNWKKNPDAPITVVGIKETQASYKPNRYGLYHLTGNVVEWTQSIFLSYNQQHPFVNEDSRRHDSNLPGQRVARGGSWYSASNAYLYIPYRDAFQPEHSSQDIGFRIVARVVL
jgi:formylglycine-generating enzyme required for sulfatase activity